jgi:hypothetical protein
MEHYTAIKKNEMMLLAGKWMELESTVLKKISSESQILYVFAYMQNLDIKKY